MHQKCAIGLIAFSLLMVFCGDSGTNPTENEQPQDQSDKIIGKWFGQIPDAISGTADIEMHFDSDKVFRIVISREGDTMVTKDGNWVLQQENLILTASSCMQVNGEGNLDSIDCNSAGGAIDTISVNVSNDTWTTEFSEYGSVTFTNTKSSTPPDTTVDTTGNVNDTINHQEVIGSWMVSCYPEGIETSFILNVRENKIAESITIEMDDTTKYKKGTWVDTQDDLIITFTLCKEGTNNLTEYDCNDEENPRTIPIELDGLFWDMDTDNDIMTFTRYDL